MGTWAPETPAWDGVFGEVLNLNGGRTGASLVRAGAAGGMDGILGEAVTDEEAEPESVPRPTGGAWRAGRGGISGVAGGATGGWGEVGGVKLIGAGGLISRAGAGGIPGLISILPPFVAEAFVKRDVEPEGKAAPFKGCSVKLTPRP